MGHTPFTEGHPSRYTDENGDNVAVHFWQILDYNRNKLGSYLKTIMWRIFMNPSIKDSELTHISIGIIDASVAKDKKLLPTAPKAATVPPSPGTKTASAAESPSSSASNLGLGWVLRNQPRSKTKHPKRSCSNTKSSKK